MTLMAILPIKGFDRAKQRLQVDVSAELRRELAAAMAADVLGALGSTAALDSVIVVTGDPDAAALARTAGAQLVDDRTESGQSAAALAGIATALTHGARRVLLVPGDCPALDPAELEALAAGAAPAPSVAVIPDRHGTGTNGLLLAPPGVMKPAFGPGSFDRHVEGARSAGAAVHIERVSTLALDVDTAGDLAALRDALERLPPAAAPRTRAVLSASRAGSG